MRGLVIAVVVVIALITGMLFFQNHLENEIGKLMVIIDDINILIDEKNKEKIDAQIETLGGEWEKTSKWLAAFYNHDEMYYISTVIGRVAAYTENFNYDEAKVCLKELSILLHSILENSQLILVNIL